MQTHSTNNFIRLVLAAGITQGIACGSSSTDDEVEESPSEELVASVGGESALLEFSGFRYVARGSTAIGDEGLEPGDVSPTGDFERVVAYDEAKDSIRIDHEGTLRFELLSGAPQVFSEVIAGESGTISAGESILNDAARPLSSDRMASTRRRIELLNPLLLLHSVAKDAVVRGDKLVLNGEDHRTFIVDEGTSELTFVVSASGDIAQIRTQESHRLHRDVTLIVDYSEWKTATGSELRMPTHVQMTVNSNLILDEEHSDIEISPAFASGYFQRDPDAGSPIAFNAVDFQRGRASHQWHQAFSGLGVALDGIVSEFEATELSTGVFFLSGGGGVHNTMIIEQGDGVVVVDGPIAPEQSATLVAWIENQFGGKPISYIVPSHFHQDHASGIRELAGAGAEIIAVDGMKMFWENLLAASSNVIPDRQSRLKEGRVTSFAGASKNLDDEINPVRALHVPDNNHAADMVLVATETANATYVFVADLYGPFGGSFILGGPEDFLRGLKQHQLIDNSCIPASPLVVVGAHGGMETIEESIAFIDGLGIDLSGICPL